MARSIMRLLSAALPAALALVVGGCASREMKGSPFYTGEYQLNVPGAELRRVNLWPVAYYREPALSLMWPVFEHTEEHLAVRPVFSAYGDTERYWEYNVLWPLCQADTKERDYRIFPYFWGEGTRTGDIQQDYHVLFPLFWHYEDETCALFPLWLIDHDGWRDGHFTEHDYWLGWPLFHYHTGLREAAWHAALFGRYHYDDPDETYTGYPWPMLFSWRTKREHGFFAPFYAFEESTGESGAEEGWSVSPPLLSWHSQKKDDSDYWMLGPLLRYRTGAEAEAWHATIFGRYHYPKTETTYTGYPWPLICTWRTQQDRGLFTPLYAHQERSDDGSGFSTVLPLLSWHSRKKADDDYWMLGPLFRYRTGAVAEAWHATLVGRYRYLKEESTYAGYPWPLLCTWQTRQNHGLFTPLYAFQDSNSNEVKDGWAALPPLLAWHTWENDVNDFYALLGLFCEHREAADRSGYLFPFYGYDRRERLLLTPLVGWDKPDEKDSSGYWYPFTPLAGIRTGTERGGWLFPFFSHTASASDDTYSTHYLLLGYANRERHGHASSERNYGFFPLFSHTLNTFTNAHANGGTTSEGYRHRDRQLILISSKESQTVHHAPTADMPPAGTNRMDRQRLETWKTQKQKGDYRTTDRSTGFFPFWSSDSHSETRLDGTRLSEDSKAALLFFIFDAKREFKPADGPSEKALDYERRRILWRVWHYEKRNGDVSVDIFPAITYDARADGVLKTTFLWRLFRYERHPEGGVDLDLFFLPLSRACRP